MHQSWNVPCWARLGMFFALLAIALPAWAGSVSVDTFRDAPADVYIYPRVTAGAWANTQADASILGGERELQATPMGSPPPATSVKITGVLGIDNLAPQGALQIGTQAAYSADVKLVYDGIGSSGLGGFDFTQGGTNNRLAFSFAWIAGVGSLDVNMTVTDTLGRQLSQSISCPDNSNPHERAALFSNFTGDAGASLTSVDKLEIWLNPSGVPNTDFAVASISLVPEPASWSLLAVGILSFAVYRRRRRSSTKINP